MAEPSETQSPSALDRLKSEKFLRGKRVGKWLLVALFVFGVFGFFAAPPLLKSVLLKELSAALHRDVQIERIDINPFALSATVAGVSVKADDGREVVGLDELYVNVSSFSILQAGVVVDQIRLVKPRVSVIRLEDGRYDISDLLDEWMKPKDEPEKPLPRFSLNNITLTGGRVEFEDRPKQAKQVVADIQLALPFISSLPYQAEVLVEPSFSALVNDAPFALKGRSKPFSGAHESELDLDLDRFDLTDLQPYLPDALPLAIKSGRLDSELKLVFKEVADKTFSLALVGGAHLSDLALTESSGTPLIGWKKLDLQLEKADLINRDVAVREVVLDGLDANLWVSRKGEFNVLDLADKLSRPAPGAAPVKAAEAAPGAPLRWSLGGFTLTNGLLRWKDESNAVPVVGEVRHIQVRVGKLDSRLADPIEVNEVGYQIDLGDRLRMETMQIKGIRVDLAAHRLHVAEVHSSQTRARMVRNKAGQIEWVGAPALKASRASTAKAEDTRPWVGVLDKLAVEDLAVRFEDQSTSPVAIQTLDGMSLQGANLGNGSGQKGSIALKGRVNQKGSLSVEGGVQLTPLNVALKVNTQAIPLLPLQPYFAEQLNVALARGQVSSQGEASVQLERDGLKAGYKGSLTLGDFLAIDKLNSADFLKWKSLYLGGIDFRLQPMAVTIGEIALSDFYSRLILNAAGRLNVQDIVKKPAGEAVATKPEAAKGEVAKTDASAKPVVPIKIAKITLQNGNVNFSDLFVKPNYTVNVTKLGGRVTGLSSADDSVADMELRGSYANLAPVQILAKLNPLAAKSFLDLKAEVAGVDLVGFSPYSGKYAGYAIEKGKLSLNLAYKLENNRLTADNRLFIDQFTFGEPIASPDATKLPVNLAISLLKNNRGEIDLNLPISGSLDDPEFSVGGLIVKVIVNLFVKAVTSPFALLGSMFGGEELSNIEFVAGKAAISDAAAKKLDALARALRERASLKLEITGRADPEADKEGLKRVAIERAMKAEKLRDILKKGGEGTSVDNIEIAGDEYKTYLTRAYKEAKFPKPRNVVGLQKELPVEEMEKLMLTNLPASEDDVRQLARSRAETVQVWLIEQGKVPADRLFLVPPKAGADDAGKGSRVDFSLR